MKRFVNQVPTLLIGGIDPEPMVAATIGLQWDMPTAVVVCHEVDPERELLVRTVSDITGVIEHEEIDVAHACTSCAMRDDIVPTLERLAASGRWESIVARLPVTAEPMQVCRVIGYAPHVAPHVKVAAVVVALDGETLEADLVGDDLFVERELPVRGDDPRGVAETTSAMTEYADAIAVYGAASPQGIDLARRMARPGVPVADGLTGIDTMALLAGVHRHEASEDWVAAVRRDDLAHQDADGTWVLDFRTARPFHPERLRERVEALGGGRRRSRGCFWLPTRPDQVCQWDGAGGMLSIGVCDEWGTEERLTRIVVVGTGEGREELAAQFHGCLLTDEEVAERGVLWEVGTDGMEPWLGPVRGMVGAA